MLRTLLVLLAFGSLMAADGEIDPLARFPVLDPVQPVPVAERGAVVAIAPGISVAGHQAIFDAVALVDSGPVDGLEVLACLDGGKAHESLVRLTTGNGELVKFAVIRAFGCDDGVPAIEGSGQPGRGVPLRIQLEWPVDDPDGAWQTQDLSCLVRDRVSDQPYQALPFIYTGSRIVSVSMVGPDGRTEKRQRFMLDGTKSVVVAFDEPDALFASPFPSADTDSRFEAYSAQAPRPGTPCRVVVSEATLPERLLCDLTGGLRLSADAEVLDDAALAVRLQAAYGADYRGLRAVAVEVVDPATPGTVDVAVRSRLLGIAADAGIWVVPVFVPKALKPATSP